MKAQSLDQGKSRFYLPDICRNTSVLILIIVVEIISLVATLLFYNNNFFEKFGLVSLYLLWISLVSTLLLCQLKKSMRRWSYWKGFFIAFTTCVLVFVIVEIICSVFIYYGFGQSVDWSRFLRLMIADILVTLMVLRVFSLLGLMEWRHKAELNARLQALQSRIRPHFLFNCLNTIAELTASRPEQAEDAIASLSALFRASLDEIGKTHSLRDEVGLCDKYLELEKWRLGERLKVSWGDLVEDTAKWEIPKLLIQPLIENAVVHGTNVDGGVNIQIDIRESSNHISIMVANEKCATPDSGFSGNGMAIENIRERLFVLYDDQQVFKLRDAGDRFQVIMRLPKRIFLGGSE